MEELRTGVRKAAAVADPLVTLPRMQLPQTRGELETALARGPLGTMIREGMFDVGGLRSSPGVGDKAADAAAAAGMRGEKDDKAAGGGGGEPVGSGVAPAAAGQKKR